MKRMLATLLAATLLPGLLATPAGAQDDDLGWFLTARFAGVWATGNSKSASVGVSAEAVKKAERSKLKIMAGTVQNYTVSEPRKAVGTEEDYVLEDNNTQEKTAELTTARVRYDYDLSDRFFTFGGVDLHRNPPAGVDSRVLFFAGAGNIWKDTDETRFRTDVAVTYTVEEEVVSNPINDTNFPGLRAGAEAFRKISETAELKSELNVDFNLKDSDDIRGNWATAMTVNINQTFALSPSLSLLWRNRPPLGDVKLYNESGAQIGTVREQLHKWDAISSVSLVARF